MDVRVVARYDSTLPVDDDHPYRIGPWRPQHTEYVATGLDVEGELPDDLDGVYLRNTENPLHDSLGRYHPFDGDGMVHAVTFGNGQAEYRNRFVRTKGFEAELAAGRPLWAGLMEPPSRSERDGWGARTRLKDASSTDVIVHNGRALTTHYQCGDAYQLDPRTLEQLGPAAWHGAFPGDGISAHPKVDAATGELFFFSYSKQAPYLHYGVVDASDRLVHHVPVELPGPRLPHDMAITERFAILNDCPLFWDPDLLARDVHAVRFYPELPLRFAVLPRHGGPGEVRWFEASPTYVLHWINAYEDGDAIVIDGFHQECPMPEARPDDDQWSAVFRFIDPDRMRPRPYRWRLDLVTGAVDEQLLDDRVLEFGTINPAFQGRRHRYSYAVTSKPGWFLFDGLVRLDLEGGRSQSYRYPDGVFISEAPMAPRVGATGEDDGYVVTLVTDMNTDRGECHVFAAADLAAGPIARLRLPERVSSGTHSCWWPGDTVTPPT